MAAFKDITGHRFGRWTVISRAPNRGRRTHWNCRCDCGKTSSIDSNNLRTGLTVSCGCYQSELTTVRSTRHGLMTTGHRKEYSAWLDAKRRCFEPSHRQFKHYGGRGITMCREWAESVEQFFKDMGPCPTGLTLDRINNDGNYEPGNCRWTTRQIQIRNQRRSVKITHNGETLSLDEWAAKTGIPAPALRTRYYGNSQVPLFAPSQKRRRRRKNDK